MIGRYGASVGKILGGKAGAYNVALVRLLFDREHIDPSWARYFCQSKLFQEPIRQVSRSAQNGFNKEDLASIEFPLPPIKAQRSIASSLDRQFERSRSIRRELDRIPQLISRYKRELLRAAFDGELIGGEAKSWATVQLGELITDIDAGKNVRCEERPPGRQERGIVKVSSVTWGTFAPEASKTPPTSVALDQRNRICPGDFLISRANTLELVGSCVMVEEVPYNNLYLSDKVLRIRFSEPVDKWVLYFLRSPEGRKQIEELATGNQLSMRNISQGAIKSIRLPLPPSELRSTIVGLIDAALNSATTALNQTERAAELLKRFDEATLSKMFSGEIPGIEQTTEGRNGRSK